LKRALQDLSEYIKSVNRGQEFIELHLSRVGLLFEFSQAYFPRPPKEIVAHCHYSPANMYRQNELGLSHLFASSSSPHKFSPSTNEI